MKLLKKLWIYVTSKLKFRKSIYQLNKQTSLHFYKKITNNKMIKITLSEKLIDILEIASNTSSIAKDLLSGEFEYDIIKKDYVNYIGVSTKEYKLSYFSKDKVRDDFDGDYWRVKYRIACKIGTIINKIFKEGYYSDREIEIFINSVNNAMVTKSNNYFFDIIKGSDIGNIYMKQVEDNGSSLAKSCMRHDRCIDYFNLYYHNPDIISLLICKENGKYVGRALLWKLQDGSILMDRIYTINDDVYVNIFKNYAIENGFITKAYQRWNASTKFYCKDKGEYDMKLSIKLPNYKYNLYPYLDTFKWMSNDGVFHNYYVPKSRLLIRDNGGTREPNFIQLDDYVNEYYKKDDMVYCEFYDSYYLSKHIVNCGFYGYLPIHKTKTNKFGHRVPKDIGDKYNFIYNTDDFNRDLSNIISSYNADEDSDFIHKKFILLAIKCINYSEKLPLKFINVLTNCEKLRLFSYGNKDIINYIDIDEDFLNFTTKKYNIDTTIEIFKQAKFFIYFKNNYNNYDYFIQSNKNFNSMYNYIKYGLECLEISSVNKTLIKNIHSNMSKYENNIGSNV